MATEYTLERRKDGVSFVYVDEKLVGCASRNNSPGHGYVLRTEWPADAWAYGAGDKIGIVGPYDSEEAAIAALFSGTDEAETTVHAANGRIWQKIAHR
jgi:hypothetical protein